MSPRTTRLAAAAAVVLLLALLGGLGWGRLRPPPGQPAAQSASNEAAATSFSASKQAMPAVKPDVAPAPKLVEVPPAASRAPIEAPPSIDVVRVEPSGDTLLAGHAAPDKVVALIDRGKVVVQAQADAGGNFVMTPPALKPGDYVLSLQGGQGATSRTSSQSVVVSVPVTKKQQVVVAMAEPGKPTALLSAPPRDHNSATSELTFLPATKPGPHGGVVPPKLAIRSIELENGSGLLASGVAPPGTDVRIYLNNSRVADVIAAAAGAWTLKVRKGLAAGRYAVRADSLTPDQSVDARVEVPFEVPPTTNLQPALAATEPSAGTASTQLADARTTSGPSPVEGPSSRADAIVDELDTEIVTRGDNLWRISRKRLGRGTRYTEIYAVNVAQIRDPKLVYPGQVFVLPHN